MYRQFVCPLHAWIVDEPLQWRRNAPDNASVTGAVDQVPGDGTDLLLMAKGGKDNETARFAAFSPGNDATGRHAEEVPRKGAGGCPTHRGPDIGWRRAPRRICDAGCLRMRAGTHFWAKPVAIPWSLPDRRVGTARGCALGARFQRIWSVPRRQCRIL